MILVSTRFPEDIPWFKASRRAVVATIFAGGGAGNVRHEPYIYHAAKLFALGDRCAQENWNEHDTQMTGA